MQSVSAVLFPGCERINVKELIRFSIALGQNLIAEVYLSPMWLAPLRYPIEDCEITIEEHEIRLENPEDPTFLMEYQRKNEGKNRTLLHIYPYKET